MSNSERKVLVIGTDVAILDPASSAGARIREYAGLFEEYHMIICTGTGFKAEATPPLFLYPTNSRFFFLGPFDAFRLGKKIIRERGVAVISVQDPAETGVAGWLLKKAFRIPLQIQLHADFFSPFFRKNSWQEYVRYVIARFLVPRADSLRVVSRRIARSLNSKFKIPDSRIAVLPIFIDRARIAAAPPSFDLRKKYPQFSFIVLMVSRLSREKNIALAIRAFKDFLKKYPDAGLIIVGEGAERKNLEFRIKNLELQRSALLVGWQEDLISYYKGADVYLLTSDFEGYGRTVVEAAAAGLPVIMTDVGVAGEIIRNKETGLVLPVGDKEKLGDALLWAHEHRGEVRGMAGRAQREVLETHPKTREEYLEMYRQSF